MTTRNQKALKSLWREGREGMQKILLELKLPLRPWRLRGKFSFLF
jgi:hypothetical protein